VRTARVAVLSSLLAGVFVTAASVPVIADGPEGPVGDIGGRSIDAGEIRILDLSVPAVRLIDRATLRSSTKRLNGSDVLLDAYGLAATGDGTLWILGGKGRFLLRFSEKTGALLERRTLPDPGQGVSALWGRVGLLTVRLRPDEPLLLRLEGREFLRFSGLASRPATGIRAALVRNLFRCGSGTADAIPCWFTAGPAEILLLGPDGVIRPVAVPSFAQAASAVSQDPGGAFTFPVRDAFVSEDGLWVLSNQEGARTPLDAGARRGRHVVLLREGRANRVTRLDREARAILDASPRALVLLFADGSVLRVAAP
jgi:hypothetical protein